MPEKQITLPFKTFIQCYLHGREKIIEEAELANLIRLIDHDEQYVHVQPPGEGSNTGKLYIVWEIGWWKTEYEKWKIDKANSERFRHRWCVAGEKKKELIQVCMNMFRLDEDRAEFMANKIIHDKNREMAKMMNVDIEELIKLDEEEEERKRNKV